MSTTRRSIRSAVVAVAAMLGLLGARPTEASPIVATAATVIPDDPLFSELYGLHNVGQSGGTSDADIDAPEAWATTTGHPDVIVFVIDTGVSYDHPDLAGNVWVNPAEAAGTPGQDDDGNGYVDDLHGINAITGSGDPMDDNGHGTHVAGTIGAVGNNGIGVAGVNWTVRIGACKFLSAGGSGSTDDAVECFRYVEALRSAGHNVLVTNNSWGGGGFSQALLDAMSDASGILHVAAAGNANTDNDVSPFYPGSYELENIVSVAASDRRDRYAGFSNWGRVSVDLAAPGDEILSTAPGGYEFLSGTDMGAAHVAGAAALVLSADPKLTATQLKARLLDTADPIGGIGDNAAKPTQTNGRLNVGAAVSARVATTLSAEPALARIGPGLHLYLYRLSARLARADGGEPIAGQTVVMTVPGRKGDPLITVCTAVTRPDGWATCSGAGSLLEITLNGGYTATFAGTDRFDGSSAGGRLLVVASLLH